MDCTHWNESLIGRLYDEISAEENVALETHLSGCAACRATLEDLSRVRGILAEDEPAVPRTPRVVVLRAPQRRWSNMALAASVVGAAVLAGLGTGAGYALGRQKAPAPAVAIAPAHETVVPASLDPATEALIRAEVARRVDALAVPQPQRDSQTLRSADLKSELAKFERKLNATRASDLDYMLAQIEASELRTGSRIGKTNDALRTVALASNGFEPAQ
jgi:hypothetical protein